MSYLFGGRPQISSEEKIRQAELEVEMVTDMMTRYECSYCLCYGLIAFACPRCLRYQFLEKVLICLLLALLTAVSRNAFQPITVKET